MLKKYYSIKEAMAALGVSRDTIYKLMKQGLLETSQPFGKGSKHKITQEQIDECMKRR